MKTLCTLGLLLVSLSGSSQVVHPAGAATVAVNWAPLFRINNGLVPDSLALDLDGDSQTDVTFISNNYSYYFPGDTPGLKQVFGLVTRQSSVQVAFDSAQLSWAHRFQAGEVIRKGLGWYPAPLRYGPAYLDYTPLGNGGSGASGFFRDGQPGYVVVRKLGAGNVWRYWWLYAASSNAGGRQVHVYFYGHTQGTALGTRGGGSPASALAYPNPSATDWLLPPGSAGAYRLVDGVGREVARGQLQAPQPRIASQGLPPGVYWLERQENGQLTRQRLSKY